MRFAAGMDRDAEAFLPDHLHTFKNDRVQMVREKGFCVAIHPGGEAFFATCPIAHMRTA